MLTIAVARETEAAGEIAQAEMTGLMRHDQRHVVALEARAVEQRIDELVEMTRHKMEHRLSIHAKLRQRQ